MRLNKRDTFAQYLAAIERGATDQELLYAIETEVKNKKESPTLENPFKYMKASVNWLKDSEYENVSFNNVILETDSGLL